MSADKKNENMPLIHVVDLVKTFGEHDKNKETVHALNGVSMDINKGDVVVIIGPSGSGKSTFLRSLNLLETPTSGHIYLEGTDIMGKNVDIDKHRQKMGMVFQHFNLFPHMTVLENLTLGPIKLQRKRRRSRHMICSTRSVSATERTRIRSSCPAARSRESRSQGRSRCIRTSCSSMSRRQPSTRRWSVRSST